MKPVIFVKFVLNYLTVVDGGVGDLSVGKHQRNRIVPGLFARRRIHRNGRCHLQFNPLHIDLRVGDLVIDLLGLYVGDNLKTDAADAAFF